MRERVEALGGRLEIGSAGNGLRIEAVIPIAGHVPESSVYSPALPVHGAPVGRNDVSLSLELVAA